MVADELEAVFDKVKHLYASHKHLSEYLGVDGMVPRRLYDAPHISHIFNGFIDMVQMIKK